MMKSSATLIPEQERARQDYIENSLLAVINNQRRIGGDLEVGEVLQLMNITVQDFLQAYGRLLAKGRIELYPTGSV